MKLSLAKPEHTEALVAFFRKVHGPKFAHPEVMNANMLRQLLRDRELEVVFASDDFSILGAGLAWPQAWNQSLEGSTG